MSKRLIAILAGLIAVAAIAGCGGGDDGDSLTKAEFIKQGDAICEKGDKAIEADAEKFAKDNNVDTENPTKAQKEEVIADVVAPDLRQQGEEIAELGAPSGDEEQAEAIVEAVEAGADELEEEPSRLFEGDNPLAKASKLAKDYGFKACGEEE